MIRISERCPVCWERFELPQQASLPFETECKNIFCPLQVTLRLFATKAEAKAALEHQSTNLPKRLFEAAVTDGQTGKLSSWGYIYREKPIRCFLLGWLDPLVRLVTKDVLSDTATAVASKFAVSTPFTFFSCNYDSFGNLKRLAPIEGLTASAARGDTPPGFCEPCKLVWEAIFRYNKKCHPDKPPAEWYHPCHNISDMELAKKISASASVQLRDITRKKSAESQVNENFNIFWHICWLGLADVAIPIYAADELIGFAFSGQKILRDFELDTSAQERRNRIFDKLEMTAIERQAVLNALEEKKQEEYDAVTKDELFRLWSDLVGAVENLEKMTLSHYSVICVCRDQIFTDVITVMFEECFSKSSQSIKDFRNKALSAVLRQIADVFCFSEALFLERHPNGKYRTLCSTFNIRSDTEFDLASLISSGTAVFFPVGKVPAVLQRPPAQSANAALVPVSDNQIVVLIGRRFPKDTEVSGYTDAWYDRMNDIEKVSVKKLCTLCARQDEHYTGLIERERELRELSRVKDDFIAEAAHRLKSPMQWLISETSTLLRRTEAFEKWFEADPKIDRSCKNIDNAVDFLNNQMKNFIIIATMDKEELTYDMKMHPLGRLLETCVKRFQRVASERKIQIKPVIPKEYYQRILFDWNQMEVVFNNLLDNAIKYSHRDQIIYVDATVDRNRKLYRVTFSDFGLGIADEETEVIFEKLRRGTTMKDPRRFIPGTGIGLTVARKIAVDHGGNVYLAERKRGPRSKVNDRDEEGWKIVFAVEIPLRKGES